MPRRIACPVCKAPVEWVEANPYRPFCSRRCKLLDLGDWASERNVIGGSDEDGLSEGATSIEHGRESDQH